MKENPNIEELLNSYIDGELTERHHIEVQRLISHDAQVAQRLRELQKCKVLVGSLPRAEAPADMLERIESSLETGAIPAQRSAHFDEREGARHLLGRKVLAAAAMIGLVAVLGVVVYTIVVPESVPPVVAFEGRLELKTSDLVAVEAVMSRAIEDHDISRQSGRDTNVYALSCSREAAGLLLADLESVWERFDSTKLYIVATRAPDGEVMVEDVNADDIASLLTPLVKPLMTGKRDGDEQPAIRKGAEKKVHLTIVLVGSE